MVKALRTFQVRPSLPAPLAPLADLAANLRWAWHPPTQELFRWADADLWEDVGGNPVELLGRLSPNRLRALAQDPAFTDSLAEAAENLERYLTGERWAQRQDPPPPRVAYFSPEFGLTHVMQTYSGGLGILAGDHLKAASDLGLDLVGVGLLYRHGYFRQLLDADGWQQERYPDLNPYRLPLRRLEVDGEPATVSVEFGSRTCACQIWTADVGRVPLLLLDTDLPQNAPEDRVVTDRLYGGDVEHRLRQEIVLGVGGVRALHLAIGMGTVPGKPAIYHSNEGHAGFLELERVRTLCADEGLSFDQAVEVARSAVIFTTHTPVPAGIDVFPRDLFEHYFSGFAAACGVSTDRLVAVGQPQGGDPGGSFNMAVMGLRLSVRANGVSQLHGDVARRMFAHLWPGVEAPEVPITSVTNGVHAPTWVGPEMRAVFDRHLAPNWSRDQATWARVEEIPDDVLWRAVGRGRERMVQRVRGWVRAQRERRGEPATALGWTDELLDPDALTIGFARRFAEYKRGTLLLSQPERLSKLLLASDRPVQFVFAGKAHPRDDIGKSLIREIVHFADDVDLRGRVVFVEDYDMDVARTMLQGVDVWLNTPRRPHEACGTSGMKAVLNGALHCSTLDGWWDELYDHENGFAIGGQHEHDDVAQQDIADASSLFDVLERLVVPMFYDRSQGALPRRWIARIKRSLRTLGPAVLATRMVQEYVTDLYVPVATRAQRLQADGGALALRLAEWRHRVGEAWPDVAITGVESEGGTEIGQRREVVVVADLGGLTPGDVAVQLVHGPVGADGILLAPQVASLACDGGAGSEVRYGGTFDLEHSGEYGMAVRIVPAHPDLSHWADTGLVTWADEALVEPR